MDKPNVAGTFHFWPFFPVDRKIVTECPSSHRSLEAKIQATKSGHPGGWPLRCNLLT
ncbi:MAG: hypothetical protein WA049_16035 [Ferribacterium limneticum]